MTCSAWISSRAAPQFHNGRGERSRERRSKCEGCTSHPGAAAAAAAGRPRRGLQEKQQSAAAEQRQQQQPDRGHHLHQEDAARSPPSPLGVEGGGGAASGGGSSSGRPPNPWPAGRPPRWGSRAAAGRTSPTSFPSVVCVAPPQALAASRSNRRVAGRAVAVPQSRQSSWWTLGGGPEATPRPRLSSRW